ncbi:MAG: KpsF/GutQ family sugar-phosphate isomerase [Bacillota bacterium]
MSLKQDYLEQAKAVLKIEAKAILNQADALGEDFCRAVELILKRTGRVVVTGMGKSGLIGRKISATLASTGTPSFFLHPAEGIHGDLGMVTPDDVVIAISGSGQNDEILAIMPTLKILGTPVISLTSSKNSTLALNSDIVLEVKVGREACPLGLAPTASTTAHLAIGDALAVTLLKARNFTAENYALFHPGGALGRKLLLTVERLMYTGDKNPLIHQDRVVRDAVLVMASHGNHGAAVITDDAGKLAGIITDGDLRRIFEANEDPLTLPLRQVMTKNPKVITKDKMAAEAIHIMEEKEITVLPVVDPDGYPVGIVQLHDVIRGLAGLK